MKKLFLFFCFLLSLNSFAQSWDGEVRWLYEQSDFAPMPDDYIEIVKVKDTLIQNKKCAIFEQRYLIKKQDLLVIVNVSNRFIMANGNGKIEYYYKPENKFLPLYDFNAKAGDSFKTSHFYTSTYASFDVKVDSVKQEFILGKNRKIQYVQGSSSGIFMYGKVIEDMGNDFFLFPTPGFVDPPPGGQLLCYSDSGQVASAGLICDLKLQTALPIKDRIKTYPMPVSNILNVEGLPFFEYKIFSIDGLLMQSGKSKNQQIDFSTFDKGIYLLQIFFGEQNFFQKITKM